MTSRERVSALAESARNGTHWAYRGTAEAVTEAPGAPAVPHGAFGAPAEVAVRGPGMVAATRERPDPAKMLGPLLEELGLYLMDYIEFRGRAELVARSRVDCPRSRAQRRG